MVTILHTGDWHLGHQLYKNDRTLEQQSMLTQMCDIVATHQPDVLLICGDVFDTGQPSAAAQTMFVNALLDIRNACPQMQIVVTAGNHDSASRHEIFRNPWDTLGIKMIGYVDANNPDSNIIEVPGKAWIIAVPYIFSHHLEPQLFDTLLSTVEQRNTDGLPVVMMAHAAVAGCDCTGHDNATEHTVGGMDLIALERFGRGYDYLALGHIHRPQTIGADNRVRYAGTPIAVNFDERYPHSASHVTIKGRGVDPRIMEIAIDNPRRLVNIPAAGYAPWNEVLGLLADIPDDDPCYVRLNVSVTERLAPNAMHLAQEAARGKQCTVCHINLKFRAEQSAADEATGMDADELRHANPIDIARMMVSDLSDANKAVVGDFDNDMEAMFRDICAALESEKHAL